MFNLEQEIYKNVKDLPNNNYLLGRTLMQPFRPANSGSRALMNSIHTEQLMVPQNPEVPIISTGFENKFGYNSSSYIQAKSNYTVLYKIDKFENIPGYHYYLIIRNDDNGEYDVIERVQYKYNTESYGFLWNNNYLDSLKPGDRINKNDTIKTSNGFDEYENKENGVNLITLYLSSAQNMEDSVIISESAAEKLATTLIKNTSITINDNDVLLNLYGNENIYKAFPDIGEKTENGIFCSIRRWENENILYSLSQSRLRESLITDRNIIINGTVADIDVYCNNPNSLGDSYYNAQLFYYYQMRNKFCKKMVECVSPLAMNGKLSYNLNKLYSICRDSLDGKMFFKEKQFSNVILEVTFISNLEMAPGDKMSDRYGGKGVVSKIVPDYLMPELDNGKVVEVIKNQSTCINRENIGQLHEQSLSFIGMRLIDYFQISNLAPTEACKIIYEFLSMVDKEEAEFLRSSLDFFDEDDCRLYLESIYEDEAIFISTPPFTTPVNLDLIAEIYKRFSFIKPYTIYMPIEDSNGNVRKIPARRPLVVGKIYNYRLKQYSEEKFSVVSLSSTNLKGLNVRSKANKALETKYTKTPVMFGVMETGDLIHIGAQFVVMNLMLYSSSPRARRLFEQLLIGSPMDIDIKLDEDSKNRNAEIINALMKTMGVRLTFDKVPKKIKRLCNNIMCTDIPNNEFKYKTNIRDIIGHDDELKIKYGIAMKRNKRHKNKPMVNKIMVEVVKKDEENTSKG